MKKVIRCGRCISGKIEFPGGADDARAAALARDHGWTFNDRRMGLLWWCKACSLKHGFEKARASISRLRDELRALTSATDDVSCAVRELGES